MSTKEVREQFGAGQRDARVRSYKDALLRALVHGAIIAVAIFYPAVWWKRVLGALIAFFVVGFIIQFRAIRKERSVTRH